MENNNITRTVSNWLAQEEKLCDLILTPDGHLFIDADCESRADWFLIFYNGNVCIRPDGSLHCFGSPPNFCTIFPIYMGETTIYANNESDCVVRSNEPILDCDISAFAVFRYGDMLGMYTADTTLSRRLHFRAMANSPQNTDYIIEAFFQQLNRHKPDLSRKMVAWIRNHFNQHDKE